MRTNLKGNKMIKNYVVRIKNLKVARLNTFLNYLNNTEHKNHSKHNTVITELSDRTNFQELTHEKIWKNAESYIKNKKGGRKLKVCGKSLTFNIPPHFQFNNTIAAELSEEISKGIKILYNTYGYDLKEEEIYKVLHNQTNPHFHVLIPYLDMRGNTLRDTKPKKFLNELKLLWNEIMINSYGINLDQYQPLDQEEKEVNKNRRYLEELKDCYLIDFNKEDKFIKNQILKIDRLLRLDNDFLDQKKKNIDLLEKTFGKVKNHNTPKKVNGPKMTIN